MLAISSLRTLVERLAAIESENLNPKETSELLNVLKEIDDISTSHQKAIRDRMEKAKGEFKVPGFRLQDVISNGTFRNLVGMVKVLQDKAQCTVVALIERGSLVGSAEKMRKEWADAERLYPENMEDERIGDYMTRPEKRVRLQREK